MPLSPAPHEGPDKGEESTPDPAKIERFTELTRRLFAIDRADFEEEVERDKAERAAARVAKKKGAPERPKGG